MTTIIARVMAGAALAWSVSMPAAAQPISCGPHETVASALAQQFQEKREAIGLTSTGMLMEVFASQFGTWTILLTSPGGVACVVAEGDSFEIIVPSQPEVSIRWP